MSHIIFDRRVLADPSWWHWMLTVPLLAASVLFGKHTAIAYAIGLCTVMCLYYFVRIGRIKPFPVQVRIAYLSLLVIGLIPSLEWVHWIQLAGTSAMVAFGYCPLLRLLKLASFNRTGPLTRAVCMQILFYEPCVGGLVGRSVEPFTASTACCSIANR